MRVQIVARLKPGVTLGQARSEAEIIAGRLRNPGAPADRATAWWLKTLPKCSGTQGRRCKMPERGLWMTAVAAELCS